MGQLDLLEAGPAEDGSEQAEQVRLFLAGEHDIMQKVFAGQEEEEERGTQVEIEVRAFCRKETVNHVEEVWRSKCMEVNGEAMGKPCSCMQFIRSRIFYYNPRENLYQVLQVTCAVSECAMKSKVHMIKSLSP